MSSKNQTSVRHNLSHPEWCNRADRDLCGPAVDRLGERWHNSDQSMLFAPADPIAGDEPLKVSSRRVVMDGFTYDDDPGFGGGIEVTLPDVITRTPDRKGWYDGGSARAFMNTQSARDLAAFLIAEADAYDAWVASEDAKRHESELEAEQQVAAQERADRAKKPKAASKKSPEVPAAPVLRPEHRKGRLPAVVTSEFHPSDCRRLPMCSNPFKDDVIRHHSYPKRLRFPSKSGGADTGEEFVVAATAVVTHESDAVEPEDYTYEAMFHISNDDKDSGTGVILSTKRLRALSDWMTRISEWVDGEHQITHEEIQDRPQSPEPVLKAVG